MNFLGSISLSISSLISAQKKESGELSILFNHFERQTRLLGQYQETDAPQPSWHAPQESRVHSEMFER